MSKAFFVLESNFTKIMFSKKHRSSYRNLQTDNSCHYIKNARISIMRENMGQRKLAFLHIFRSSVLKTHQKWSISIKSFYLQQSITIKGIDIDHKAPALASLSMKNKFMTELPQKKKKNTSKKQQATYCNHNDIDHKAPALASLSMKNKFMTELPQKKKKNTLKKQQATYCNHNMPLLSTNFSI